MWVGGCGWVSLPVKRCGYYDFSCSHPIRLAGYSPFQGETNQETFLNVSMVDYSFDDEIFDQVSDMCKDFIHKLLVKTPK